MSKRKILTLALALSMVAILAVGGTLAYFMDTDKASNTFELGGVDIELIEKAYKNGQWVEIENPNGTATLGQLDPIVDDWSEVTAAGYAYNKCVFTINNEDDAYIRNYVAIESDDNTEVEIFKIWYANAGVKNPSEAENGDYRHGAVITETFENVPIKGNKYDIYVFDTVDNAIVETGDSFQTLTTVILQDWVTNADVEKLGAKLEVYTFSEAIQATGLTHAEAMTALIGEDGDLENHAINLITGLVNPQ